MVNEIIIGISGASGVQYGIRLLETLKTTKGVKTHLVLSDSAKQLIGIETDRSVREVEDLADHVYKDDDFTAPIASGSHRSKGMIVAPCSMKSLASIAMGMSDTLLSRAADVCLKENRRLILSPRETPFNAIHLQNMLTLSRMGVIIMPPIPAFYTGAQTMDDMVQQFVGKILDHLGVASNIPKRWGENYS